MHKRHGLAIYRIFFALLALCAIAAQIINGLDRPQFSFANFFSFFTIESNILALIVFMLSGIIAWRGGKQTHTLSMLRGGATLYMTTTGIVYVLLLSGLEQSLQTPIPWVNTVLHYIMPAAVLLDWLIDPPRLRIPFKRALVWLVFPLAYLAYSLVRGHGTGWYPYPFLNPAENGYFQVVVTGVVIAAAMVIFVAIATWSTSIRAQAKT